MNKYIKCDGYGKILERVMSNRDEYTQYGYTLVNDLPEVSSHYIDGVFYSMPPSPSPFHIWNEVQAMWELPVEQLDLAKRRARDKLNAARDTARNSGFEAFGKTFDSDEASRTNIIFASQAANMLPEDFTVNWTCADNSQITLSKAQLLQLPVFLVSAGNVIHQRALELKAQIDAANTLEEINVVTW